MGLGCGLLGGRPGTTGTAHPPHGAPKAAGRSGGALVAGAKRVHRGGAPVVLICLQVTLGTWNSHRSLKEDLVVLPPKMYMVSSTAHAQCPLRCAEGSPSLAIRTSRLRDV